MRRLLVAILLLVIAPLSASAQPFNVRTWYADGQVFVVWQFPAPPAVPTDSVEIYASAAAQVTVANMTRVGRLFFPEYTGSRLTQLLPGARLQVPTPAGGTYRLAADEGVFVYTPHNAGNLFFAVVDAGSTVVGAGNSASAAFNYDPVNQPVIPHLQFSGFTPGGHPYAAWVLWADGRDDHTDRRPDVPVLANRNKNGVPHVFTISYPNAPLPPGPTSLLVACHGGGGEYQLFRPGIPARANMSLALNDGFVLTLDDSIFANVEGVLDRSNTSWFGYAQQFDPFSALPRTNPAATDVIVNYTSRRVFWLIDWLLADSGIDPGRVAIVGHSGGGRGTSHLSRQQPQRFCAAVCYTPASDLTIDDGLRDNFLHGDWDLNLPTSVTGPAGTPLGVTDLFTMTTRISATERDFPLTRIFYGKRDEEGPAAWTPSQRTLFDALDDSGMGFMLFFDEREHGVEKWDQETNDATDGHTGPWPDIGQWVAPVRTYRSSAQYLVDIYRPNQSYPGFFNADFDSVLAGQQPDPGPGDPNLGEPFGTWGGYFDWDAASLVDEPRRWACTLFATGLSTVTIDNCPVAAITTDLSPRRTRNFNPGSGKLVQWQARDPLTLAVLQSGSAAAQADGVVTVSGLMVPRDPSRIRVFIQACIADFNNSGLISVQDIFDFLAAYFAGDPAADVNGSGAVTVQDIFDFLAAYFAGCA